MKFEGVVTIAFLNVQLLRLVEHVVASQVRWLAWFVLALQLDGDCGGPRTPVATAARFGLDVARLRSVEVRAVLLHALLGSLRIPRVTVKVFGRVRRLRRPLRSGSRTGRGQVVMNVAAPRHVVHRRRRSIGRAKHALLHYDALLMLINLAFLIANHIIQRALREVHPEHAIILIMNRCGRRSP